MKLLFTIYKLAHYIAKKTIYTFPISESLRGRLVGFLSGIVSPNRIVRNIAPNPIQFDNCVFFYRDEDEGDIELLTPLLRGEFYESEIVREIKNILRPGMIFVDGGAHIGYFSVIGAKLVSPDGKVFAFEPYNPSLEVLKRNITINKLANIVVPEQKAIAEKRSTLDFIVPLNRSVSVKLQAADLRDRKHNKISMEAISLDEYFSAMDFPEISLIKLDIEGSEVLAFRGMKAISRRNPKLILIVELNFNNLKGLEIGLSEFFEPLFEIGFSNFYILSYTGRIRINPKREMNKLLKIAEQKNLNLLCEKGNENN